MRYRWFQNLLIVAAIVMMAGPAHAQPGRRSKARKPSPQAPPATAPAPLSCDREHPWYCGVSTDDKTRAMELYKRGNQQFDDSLFSAAVTSYRAALVYWNHPGIHYNLMLTLVALDRPIEAYESSMEALRYGSTALEPEDYRRARDYQGMLRGRIAELTITCDEPGAVVSLDGKNVLRGPGKLRLLVLPGQHEIVAKKPGYLATHHTLEMAPAKPVSVQLRMLPSQDALITTRRWASWQPWVVVGSGVGVGLAGALLEWRAVANNRAFATLFEEICPNGCPEAGYTAAMKSRQQLSQRYALLGHGTSVAGGIAVISGLVLVYLNRPYQLENPERGHLIRVSMMPLLSPDANGLALSLPF
jgi:PEGA domain